MDSLVPYSVVLDRRLSPCSAAAAAAATTIMGDERMEYEAQIGFHFVSDECIETLRDRLVRMSDVPRVRRIKTISGKRDSRLMLATQEETNAFIEHKYQIPHEKNWHMRKILTDATLAAPATLEYEVKVAVTVSHEFFPLDLDFVSFTRSVNREILLDQETVAACGTRVQASGVYSHGGPVAPTPPLQVFQELFYIGADRIALALVCHSNEKTVNSVQVEREFENESALAAFNPPTICPNACYKCCARRPRT